MDDAAWSKGLNFRNAGTHLGTTNNGVAGPRSEFTRMLTGFATITQAEIAAELTRSYDHYLKGRPLVPAGKSVSLGGFIMSKRLQLSSIKGQGLLEFDRQKTRLIDPDFERRQLAGAHHLGGSDCQYRAGLRRVAEASVP
ncbi:hypothetical protein PAXINDRAFT_156101 [Paxillus involutus ATCC 200175]|uniref:Uncharacterized protein n=1 Tax=Paxillus involutus ATCC 200175 TaxID=664439 RepID=A0A0C9U5E7_PAXIN|nr:hypothetical protein PAXINDRAFT_156101 [Paxillus involutus ATCC 200175]